MFGAVLGPGLKVPAKVESGVAMRRGCSVAWAALGLVVSAVASAHPHAQHRAAAEKVPGPTQAYTPAKGHPERTEILDALRRMLKAEKKDLVFVVDHLKVKDGWAWAQCNPRSPDGRTRLEPVWALLRKQEGEWRILYVRPCCADCADDPDCADEERLYRKLKREFQQAPAEIFPGPR